MTIGGEDTGAKAGLTGSRAERSEEKKEGPQPAEFPSKWELKTKPGAKTEAC